MYLNIVPKCAENKVLNRFLFCLNYSWKIEKRTPRVRRWPFAVVLIQVLRWRGEEPTFQIDAQIFRVVFPFLRIFTIRSGNVQSEASCCLLLNRNEKAKTFRHISTEPEWKYRRRNYSPRKPVSVCRYLQSTIHGSRETERLPQSTSSFSMKTSKKYKINKNDREIRFIDMLI